MIHLLNKARHVVYETNDVDSYNPEVWANESLMILQNNMVMPFLVHRDFEDEIQEQGDIVNTRKPDNFTAKRKDVEDDVTVQNATAPNVAVPLDQHIHTTFRIRDSQMSKSFKNLVTEFLEPAVISLAQACDQIIIGQAAQWLNNRSYYAGGLSQGSGKTMVTRSRRRMTDNQAPMAPRHMVHSPSSEEDINNVSELTNANTLGDEGTRMREANLGRLLGFNHWVDQNVTSTTDENIDKNTAAVNLAAGYAAGTTTMVIDGASAGFATGDWFKVAGDNTPQRITSGLSGTAAGSITFTPGLSSAVADNAELVSADPALVNNSGGYAIKYAKEIAYDGATNSIKTGQMVAFGTATDFYTVIEGTSTTILLDRPLEAAIADNAEIRLVPPGNFNFAWHPNAISFVNRPLAAPDPNTGVRGATLNFNGIAIRVVMTYDGIKQGHLVTVDLLCGVKVLDLSLGCLAFS